jgi:hypothetical protein
MNYPRPNSEPRGGAQSAWNTVLAGVVAYMQQQSLFVRDKNTNHARLCPTNAPRAWKASRGAFKGRVARSGPCCQFRGACPRTYPLPDATARGTFPGEYPRKFHYISRGRGLQGLALGVPIGVALVLHGRPVPVPPHINVGARAVGRGGVRAMAAAVGASMRGQAQTSQVPKCVMGRGELGGRGLGGRRRFGRWPGGCL